MREDWRKQAIVDVLTKYGVAQNQELTSLFLEHAKVAFRFELVGEETYEEVGNSRIAGQPDLPPSIEWPCTQEEEAYTFLAQINLNELPFLPSEDWPSTGMLYFFIGLDEPAYNIDHKVIYYNGDLTNLALTDLPEGVEEVNADEREFISHQVTWQPHLSLPDLGEDSDVLCAEYEELYTEVCDVSDALAGGLQSWAGETQLDAYLCRNGLEALLFNTYKIPERLEGEAQQALTDGRNQYADHLEKVVIPLLRQYKECEAQHEQAARNWQILFSLSSLNEVNMCWWDAGYLEFLIDIEDLKEGRFDNIYLNLATS
ncbi:YwqG family protein [Lysinibacillus louembei]|uniref:YwqG family protein n=1 Tax=Lysinibacillus louembei TaxID=1470088 RepID=A0ABZ0S1Y0_9BACI|nr:YwqG family protein [Lysinibacillus louembei]WPK13642.1 YwqG family protein [Lysinibacillus louembei]